ncbi:MAG TPA: hypothetical protein VLV81_14840 [Acidimicrobiia bacterium]|nr:hypothetical protein [Acidimicrobiia bacterium]
MRRGFWLVTGFGIGVAAATKARRRLETTAARLAPTDLTARLRRDVAAALDAARHDMHERETRLRHVLAAPEPTNPRGNDDPGQ